MTSTMAAPPRKIDYHSLKHLLVRRREDAHKGDFGHVLVVGGDQGFGGAALMAAESAARIGAGLVSVATHPSHAETFLARRPELMTRGIEQGEELEALLSSASVVALGPGLGKSDWSRLCLRITLKKLLAEPVPLVADADALNLVSQGEGRKEIAQLEDFILTPHPGEAGRLLNRTVEAVQNDRVAAALALQAEFGGVIVLKGAGTLVCYRQGARQQVDQCAHGNPGMATGGMGDVLSGVLGGLLAQHCKTSDSARLGVCLHGKSADLLARDLGERGMLATDLPPLLRQLANPE